ncbi:MAG: hypothetical protein OJF59_000594 [Cytophagales bacterium]|jgi:hypothetical protein|nr:MAG: hypothetical protein OJF59_000594 [Cytophagales bacterium]
MTNKPTIIGIDPAPAKGSTIFDGIKCYPSMNPDEVIKFIEELEPPVLICWDAPLTGPGELKDGMFTDRPIEKYFRRMLRQEPDKQKVGGISVQGYAGCTHWTVSKYIFGLPRISRLEIDEENLPFKLATSRDSIKKHIIEVHPAMAIYLWLENVPVYKRKPNVAKDLFGQLKDKGIFAPTMPFEIKDDDQLDALVAYSLGRRWIDNAGVSLIGDKKNGQLLLPDSQKISQEDFREFLLKKKKEEC